jgi:hypothetical protein
MDEKHAGAGEPTPREEKRQSATRYLRLNRLPTLQEVLDRRTRPPLDLFCFYVSGCARGEGAESGEREMMTGEMIRDGVRGTGWAWGRLGDRGSMM